MQQSPAEACSDTRKVAPVYFVFSGEVPLNATSAKAWPHVLNYTSWQNYPVAQHVSGPVGAAGEVVLLQKKEAGFEPPPYYARTLLLEPGRRVLWKIFFTEDPATSDFFGTVDFRLKDAAPGKSLFEYDVLYEFRVRYQDESELKAFYEQQLAGFAPVFEKMWPKLQHVVEHGA